ncbi:hypothetical protein F4781DRAFT_59481 [Annulohypoxylon bovei var. microspora]|nr:hypothetical protein F4781DRAFT_59481 [Annulohypoxylon bovei var. microspora]
MTTVSPELYDSRQRFLSDLIPSHIKTRGCLAREPNYEHVALKQDRVRRPTRVSKPHANRIVRHRKHLPSHSAWGHGDEDDRRLAADPSVILPSDRRPKKPRLERQEAFREPNAQLFYSDAVDDDAELYKLGLLYDDEHVRGSRFSLDTIVHTEPVYSVRPAKRARRQRQDMSYLHLDLSFAALGSDTDIQHYLAPDLALLTPPPEDAPTFEGRRESDTAPARSYKDAALTTIPELPESSIHSFGARASKTNWFPDLIPDTETDEEEEEEEEEENEDGQDWALLEVADILSTAGEDAEDTAVDAASATGEAWIVLGDGS